MPAAEGIGLSNTRERLERHYGAAAALLCANAPAGGAVVQRCACLPDGGARGSVVKEAARIRAVIADDEPLAREGLRLRLAQEPDIVVVGEAAEDGEAAVQAIARLKPDLVFLDVQMPGKDKNTRCCGNEVRPAVVYAFACACRHSTRMPWTTS